MPIATPQGTLDFKSVDKVTFVGASSNTVIDTTTGSLGVGVGVGGPTSNLHVVGNTRLEGDIDMLHTANTASIKLNSNVVTEFPRSKKLIKYPRVAIASGQSGLGDGYTQDGYTILVSSEWGGTHMASNVFNNIQAYQTTDHAWLSSNNPDRYTPSTGMATSADTFQGVNGSWVGLTLPEKIRLSSVHLYNRNATSSVRPARKGIVWGSDGGSTWYKLKGFSNGSLDGALNVITVESDILYDQFRVQITEIHNDPQKDAVAIGELEFYGTPEYDSEAHGTDVVVKSEANVPNTDWLEVYYDAKGLTDISSGVPDLSGNSVNGVVNGNTSVSDGAFVFDGTGDYIHNSRTSGYTASSVYTASVWVKFLPDGGSSSDPCIFQFGNGSTHSSFGMISNTSQNKLRAFIFGNNAVDMYVRENHNWFHLCAMYYSSRGRIDFFINGIFSGSKTSETNMTIDGSTPYLSLGVQSDSSDNPISSTYFTGSIANFRLFNRALASEEVWQLYAYQKEYFGHGDLGMTLKAGRLGIGTSEPRAVLDVRGDVIMSGFSKVSAINSANAINYTNSKYKVHKFTGNGTLTVTNPGMIEYIIVGGGGGGSTRHGGAGAGGGVVQGFMFVASGTYDVVIGAGGSPPYTTTQPPANNGPGTPGSPSTFAGLTAFGGGGGRSENSTATPGIVHQGTGATYVTSTHLATTGGGGAAVSNYYYPHHHGIQGYRGGRGNATPNTEASHVGGGGGGAGGDGAEAPQGGSANSGGANGGVGRKILGLGPQDQTEYFGGGGGSDLPEVNAGSVGLGGLGLSLIHI